MKQRFGNLVKEADLGLFDVILHGCNCTNHMGAGIAHTIRKRWPEAYDADTEAAEQNTNRLGNLSIAEVDTEAGGKLTVVNCYTQYKTYGERPADYEAIAKCFEKVNEMFKGQGKKIGIPLIGCGLAGGNWNIVEVMAKELMKDLDITTIHFPDGKDQVQFDVAVSGEIVIDETTREVKHYKLGSSVYEPMRGSFVRTQI